MNTSVDELERLADLYERGSLSAGEFSAAKASLLGPAPEMAKADNNHKETPPPTEDLTSSADASEEALDFPMWAVFRPIRTDGEARSLLKSGYYAATVFSIQGVVFLSKYPVHSNADNVVILLVLLVAVAGSFYAARKVSTHHSVIAAWCLLAVVSFQMFGVINGRGFGVGTLILGVSGVIVGIQAVRATRACRVDIIPDPSL